MQRALAAVVVLGLMACHRESPIAPELAQEPVALARGGGGGGQTQYGQYSARFADAPGDRLRGDDGTAYVDGGPGYDPNCVLSLGGKAGGGVYQLRTIHPQPSCTAVARPGWRYFTFDFGTPSVDLDQDGVAESIESAPGRMLVSTITAGAASTTVRILVFVVNPDGSTTWVTRWSLHFRKALLLSDAAAGGRVLRAPAGDAAVDIYAGYVDIPIKKNVKPVATAQLPFALTLTPLLAP